MKPSIKNKEPLPDEVLGNADELIREVTEHVAAHAVPVRRSKKRKGSAEQPAVMVPQVILPVPAAPVPEVVPAASPVPAFVPVMTPPKAPVVAAPVKTPAAQKKASSSGLAAIQHPQAKTLAIFCYDDPSGMIGAYAGSLSGQLSQKGVTVHIFSRKAYPPCGEKVHSHELGDCPGETLVASAQEFASRVQAAFARVLGTGAVDAVALGLEWTSIPALLAVRSQCVGSVLSLHSLERQRSDMRSELSQKIHAIEMQGLREADCLLAQQLETVEVVRKWAPESFKRVVTARHAFPVDQFRCTLDQGEIKKRIQVGPVDPLVLFIGPLDERHGPDLLVKCAPHVLRNHRQARFAFVGDGKMQWPLRVHSRYLLLDYAVRILGHMSGQGLHELIHAADIVAVPSRERTTEWPVLAAWAARRPVMATHNAASGLVQHDHDGLLVYPSENSLVWGIDRLLNSHELRTQLSNRGHEKLQARYGWDSVAIQIQELMQTFAQAGNGKETK